jgi:hypothetical protein
MGANGEGHEKTLQVFVWTGRVCLPGISVKPHFRRYEGSKEMVGL